jgi:hypothetical protein
VGRETIEAGKVCMERWAGKTLKIGKESLSVQSIFNSTEVLDPKIKNKRHCCARVLGFLQGMCAQKGGQGNTQNRD